MGLAVDTPSETLFVTYEVSNLIQLLDAKTMTGIGGTTAPGAPVCQYFWAGLAPTLT